MTYTVPYTYLFDVWFLTKMLRSFLYSNNGLRISLHMNDGTVGSPNEKTPVIVEADDELEESV
jgi:hypothetical protein